MAFEHEFWTLDVTINYQREQVYIKVTPTELVVGCSAGTNKDFLSHYAYCTVYQMMKSYKRSGFYDYYWPDLGTGALQKKYLKFIHSKTGLEVLSKDRLQGLFKPGQFLPKIEIETQEIKRTHDIKPKKLPYERDKIISYNLLATPFYHWGTVNYYPCLMPYQGVLNEDKTDVELITKYIFDYTKLSGAYELTSQEQHLNEISFSMLSIAPVKPSYDEIGDLSMAEIMELNIENFSTLLKLWRLAFPLLHNKPYTYYFYTIGLFGVTENPTKSRLKPCTFNNQQVELCILWKEHTDHYSLELMVWIDGKAYPIPNLFDPSFFVVTAENPQEYYLLNSVTDCRVLTLFAETEYKLLVLKVHYELYFKLFEDQLRTVYKFIDRK